MLPEALFFKEQKPWKHLHCHSFKEQRMSGLWFSSHGELPDALPQMHCRSDMQGEKLVAKESSLP